ncbi:hypothetical protein E0Z10_g9082 [Xylaria hypoxylon]|uniref:Uncharacterized protein n=1 Tax=Xylaria hypoxylon TaxID=37992 RepID=A0A4Z0Y9P9_9PEZI|nr:hypothetical protein E0Z10_g9082 [Xylaria hypoxylon]
MPITTLPPHRNGFELPGQFHADITDTIQDEESHHVISSGTPYENYPFVYFCISILVHVIASILAVTQVVLAASMLAFEMFNQEAMVLLCSRAGPLRTGSEKDVVPVSRGAGDSLAERFETPATAL